MAAEPTREHDFDETTLQAISTQLACPVCHGDLRLEAERLVCGGCGRGYPIVDGIPVLIAGRASQAPVQRRLPSLGNP
jgi:uncharacterized protein YbaR (Trm112 family)